MKFSCRNITCICIDSITLSMVLLQPFYLRYHSNVWCMWESLPGGGHTVITALFCVSCYPVYESFNLFQMMYELYELQQRL